MEDVLTPWAMAFGCGIYDHALYVIVKALPYLYLPRQNIDNYNGSVRDALTAIAHCHGNHLNPEVQKLVAIL